MVPRVIRPYIVVTFFWGNVMEKKRFIFDLDGTLLKSDYSYEHDYFESVLGKQDAQLFVPNISQMVSEYEKKFPRYDFDTFSRFLTKESGVVITNEMVKGWCEALVEANICVIDDVYEILDYLKRQGKSMVVLTNWFTDVQRERLERCLLSGYFDQVYGGSTYMKPFRESYYNACGDYSKDECVMIGDDLENDVLGPMKFGIDAIYYNPKGKTNFDRGKVKSIGRIKEIKEMY